MTRSARIRSLLLALAATALRAADGDLDTDGFHPPAGYVTLGGDTSTNALGGAIAPDGVAVPIGQWGAGIWWGRVFDVGDPEACVFVPAGATGAFARDGLFDEQGRLVLTGAAHYPALGKVLFVARFLYPACTLDPTFSGDGYFVQDSGFDLEGLRLATTRVMTVPPITVERIVVAGQIANAAGDEDLSDLFLLRLRGDGEADLGFGAGNGWVIHDVAAVSNYLSDLAVDAVGRLVVYARQVPENPNEEQTLARLLPGGALDGSFGSAGIASWDCRHESGGTGTDRAGGLAIEEGGALVVAAAYRVDPPEEESTICLLRTTHGTSSTTARFDAGPYPIDYEVAALELQGDGRRIVVVEYDGLGTDDDIATFARTTAGGADSTWGSGGFRAYDLDLVENGGERASAIALQAGRPVIFGSALTPGGSRAIVLRLESAYIFADGFESGSTRRWIS